MNRLYLKFIKDFFIVGIANLLVGLGTIILLTLLSKTLGINDYGLWAQIQVTIMLVTGVTGLGLPFALNRFLPAKTDKREIQEEFYSVLCVVFFVNLIISFLIIIFADFIAKAFFDDATQIVRITAIIILVWSQVLVFLNLFRSFRQMKMYSIFMIADMSGQIVISAYLVSAGYGIFSIVLSLLIIRSGLLLLLIYLTILQLGIKKPKFLRIKEYLAFGLPGFLAPISAWIVASSDRFVIGFFLEYKLVGVYSAAYIIGSTPIMIATVISFILPPTLSNLYDRGKINDVKIHLSYSLKCLLAVSIPFVFGATALAKPVLSLFSTSDAAQKGYVVVPLVGLSMLILVVLIPMEQILNIFKRTKIIGAVWVICALVNLGLNILIIPLWGITGAAVTTLIAYTLAMVLMSYFALKELRFNVDWHFILISVTASTMMTIVVWLIYPQSNIATILTILVGAVIYVILLILLRGFKKEELKFIKGLLNRN